MLRWRVSAQKQEAEKNNEAAKVWIFGLEPVKRRIVIERVSDLPATPFVLRGWGTPKAHCSLGYRS